MVEEQNGDGLAPVELDGGHVFRMRTVQDVFRKLWREKRRYIDAGNDRRDQIDTVINFAVTAWHMADWVWERHRDTLPPGIHSNRELKRYLRQESPHLAACDVIANAAKHGGAANQQDNRPNVETLLIAHPIDEDPHSPLEVQIVAMMNRDWSLRIRVDGRDQQARVVLEGVTLFWHRFLQQWCRLNDVVAPEADDEQIQQQDPTADA